jgi:glycosyltransferase involved in cell wall biosynthesis
MTNILFSVGVWLPGGGMGNHAYYLVKGLERHGLLQHAYVMRRVADDLSPALVRDFYVIERLSYRLARCLSLDQYVVRDNLFDFWISRQLPQATIFYGWTHHALYSLKAAKRKGMLTIIERANTHPVSYTRLLKQEYAARGIRQGAYHPHIFNKHLQELQETDYVAVTSEFTKQSLIENGIDEHRILLTPLGVNTDHFHPPEESPDDEDVFRVVYVGQISLRKGVHYLLEAWSALQLHQAELVLVGDVLPELQDDVTRHLAQTTTITLCPYASDPASAYQGASVFILPTLEDGFGLVVLEAMACGVPVIITEHTGAKDCVRSGLDGFVIPPYSVESIADTLKYCYTHRSELQTMGRQAREQAEQFPWSRYQDGIAAHLQRIAPQ